MAFSGTTAKTKLLAKKEMKIKTYHFKLGRLPRFHYFNTKATSIESHVANIRPAKNNKSKATCPQCLFSPTGSQELLSSLVSIHRICTLTNSLRASLFVLALTGDFA